MNDPSEVLGRRIGAALLDFIVLLVLFFVLALLIGESESSGGSASIRIEGGGAVVLILVWLAYYFGAEAATGQTLGKKLLGIRVVSADGGKPGAGAIALRTLLRLVDGILFYLVGLVVILASGKRRQRLGDMAAKTTVVAA